MMHKAWNRAAADEARRLKQYELVVGQLWADLDRSLPPEDAVRLLLTRNSVQSPEFKPKRTPTARGVSAPDRARTGTVLRAWQEEALRAWEQAGRVGVVEAVTGTGKTQVGVEAAAGEIGAGGKVLVIVPTVALLEQWKQNFNRTFSEARVGLRGDGHHDDHATHDVIVSTVNSARSLSTPRRGLLVADECHRYGAENWFDWLNPRYESRLGLTATYERGDEGDIRLATLFGANPVYHIGYKRAIADDIVAHFKLAFVGVALSFDEQRRYNEASDKCASARFKLIDEFELTPEPFSEFMKQAARAADGKWHIDPARALRSARTYVNNFQKRRKIVAESQSKTTRLRDLLPSAKAARGTLIFTQTKAAAANAALLFGSVGGGSAAVYGGMDRDDREYLLEQFGTGRKSVLAAPRVLDEGIDVPEADLGIVVSASSSKRQMIQRMGRVLRKKSDNRPARLVILYAERTMEDPAMGAHGSFIDMAVDHADARQTFPSDAPAASINNFLL